MFCYQCEQTAKGEGCSAFGVCGKDPETSDLQDALIFIAQGISYYSDILFRKDPVDRRAGRFVIEALFTTVTNVDFDPERIAEIIRTGIKLREELKEKAPLDHPPKQAVMDFPQDISSMINSAAEASLENNIKKYGESVAGLMHLVLYGLKGTAAYADHAAILGIEDDDVYRFFFKALSKLTDEKQDIGGLKELAMETGAVNLKVMEMLDKANTGAYGNPVPVQVRITPVKGKAILISGHDLKDLEMLLKQTEGKGINVYTHGEMLPAHGYPELKKYKHLAGNYGSAWQNQREEFDKFPGAVLMTTNCIQKPKESYKGRIFTTGLVAWPGVVHIGEDKDFSPVIEAAMQSEGFTSDSEEKSITVGFGHNAVLSVADTVIELVKSGKIKHFFLVGGCDGAKPGRNYYTEFVEKTPKDTIVMTLACGKYRFNKLDLGTIEGIPRLLDIGQCNDAYSAIKIAVALADAFNTDVNSLPLSMILSWYEQKAVCILLTLLHLGIRNIKLGPSMPAFVKPDVYDVLKREFNLLPITAPDEDIKEALS